MPSVVVRNVFMRRIPVLAYVLLCGRCSELGPTSSHIYFLYYYYYYYYYY
jgi:hypothetical protein